MVLADYDTAVEQIAALKCAMMDPSLVNIVSYNGTLTTTEKVFIINWYDLKIDGVEMFDAHGGNNIVIDSGHTVSGYYSDNLIMYIKDSDIIYTDPITLYQDRLAYSFSTTQIISSSVFSVGVNGSLLFGRDSVKVNKSGLISIKSPSECIPIPAGETIGSVGNVTYFDVPSDW